MLVTDYLMPGIRGGELIEKSKAIRPDLRALLITGYARLGIGELAGIARISKPFRASDLAREIGKLLADGQVIDMATHRKGR